MITASLMQEEKREEERESRVKGSSLIRTVS
jgi:hypothetical protein